MKTLILSIALVLGVSGCSQTTADTFCANYIPVTYDSAKDTAPTKAQIKENNAVWVRLCRKF